MGQGNLASGVARRSEELGRQRLAFALAVALLESAARPLDVRADEAQLWAIGRVDRHLTERWAGQLLVRFRFDEDVSRAKDFMLRGLSHWRFGAFDLGVGYDYLYSFVTSTTTENRLFQVAEHKWQPFGPAPDDWVIRNRIRIDERFRTDVDGMILRLRYRMRTTHGIGRGWYLAVSDEVFFNVIDRGAGPPYGFDENRLRFASGRVIVPGVRVEFGYEWQLSAGRDRADVNRHVVFVTIMGSPETFRAGRGD